MPGVEEKIFFAITSLETLNETNNEKKKYACVCGTGENKMFVVQRRATKRTPLPFMPKQTVRMGRRRGQHWGYRRCVAIRCCDTCSDPDIRRVRGAVRSAKKPPTLQSNADIGIPYRCAACQYATWVNDLITVDLMVAEIEIRSNTHSLGETPRL
jgi:hypothetical protein